jgi:hypothetical protein
LTRPDGEDAASPFGRHSNNAQGGHRNVDAQLHDRHVRSSVGLVCAPPSHASCIPKGLATPAPQDPVARVLAKQNACPKNAVEFVDVLKRSGARLEPTMVNFVGFHNPDPGAFFIFEIASSDSIPPSGIAIQRGDLLFGHFTAVTRTKDSFRSNPTKTW